jgi:Methylamine utilisation protein MauE
MSPFAGPLFAASLLLGAAGIGKVLRPDATRVALRSAGLPSDRWTARLLGAVEFAGALGAVAVGGWLHATFVAGCYAGFAWFSWRLATRTRGQASCGCFGDSSAPVGRLHVAVNLAVAAVVTGAIVQPPDGLATVAADTPWTGVPFLLLTALTTWMLYVTLTVLPTTLAAAKQEAAT